MIKNLKDYIENYKKEYITIDYVKEKGDFNFKKDNIKYSSGSILLSVIGECLEKAITSNDITLNDIDKIKELIKIKLDL